MKYTKTEPQGNTKKKKKKEPHNFVPTRDVQLPADYPWVVLGEMIKDLADFLTESEKKLALETVRSRSVEKVKQLSQVWGLQSTTPRDTSLFEFCAKYQISAMLKKFQFTGSDEELEAKALEKFLAAEVKCSEVNHRGFPRQIQNEELDLAVWSHARDFIKGVLGDTLPEREQLFERARHGPGATLSTKHGMKDAYYKYSQVPYSCTADALGEAKALIRSDDRWFRSLLTDYCFKNGITCTFSYVRGRPSYSFIGGTVNWKYFWSQNVEIVKGNRIAFVDKNAFTKRSIAIEPTLNLMLQLGVDGFIRRRLKTRGVDLDDQSKNQELARRGSLVDSDESFVTLDLAAASDTISIGICKWLLPECWYDYLMKLRSPSGEVGDDEIVYSKLSSMGNGYTFAVESLIFASLIYGVIKTSVGPGKVEYDDFACYGDDLIVKSKHASALVSILRKSGFDLNTEKSFLTGPIRESCGSDWLRGLAVRPVTLTVQPSDIRDLWCDINRIQRVLMLRFNFDWGESKTVQMMEKWIPWSYKTFQGPMSDEDMDSYLHCPRTKENSFFSRQLNSFRFKRLIETYEPVHIGKRQAWNWQVLKHNLKELPKKEPFQALRKINHGSSRFEVSNMLSTYFSFKITPTLDWSDSYGEL